MAEERIKGVYFKECNTKCDAVFDLTREEAIERMAKAIKKVPKASGEVVHWQDYDKWAEAALNALLEGK